MTQRDEQQEPKPKSEAELRQIVRGIVGDVMDQREQESAQQAKKPSSFWRNRTVILSFVLGLIIATFALTTILPRVLSNDLKTMPAELLGVWNTTDARYADRAFEIKTDSLIFHTGDGSFTQHSIKRVNVVREDSVPLYTVDYLIGDDLYTFSFYYDRTPDTIRFQNQSEMKWTR
jgi:hypothetical protein